MESWKSGNPVWGLNSRFNSIINKHARVNRRQITLLKTLNTRGNDGIRTHEFSLPPEGNTFMVIPFTACEELQAPLSPPWIKL